MTLSKKIQTNFSHLKTIQYLPRWIIFSIDISIVIFSAITTHFILKGIGIDFQPIIQAPFVFALFVGTHLCAFWYFKTFTGIVRHTTLNDAAKLFLVELLC